MEVVVKRQVKWPGTGVLWFFFYVALALLTLGANPFKAETITPLDALAKHRAWSWVDPSVVVRKTERSDILNALLPGWSRAREQVRAGELPLWNDAPGGGGTLVTPNSSTFTPAFLIFSATPDPARGFHLAVVFNLAMAGFGMHLFLRRRVGWLSAAVGGISFAYCGFNAAWLYWPHVLTLIWAPWLLLAIDRCAARPGMGPALGIAISSALILLGGFPFVGELAYGAGGLYALILLLVESRGGRSRWRFVAWYASGVMLGLLLCALPLYEFVIWMQQFDLGYRVGRGSYLGPEHMSRLLPPWSYAHQRVEQTMYVGLAMLLLAAGAVAGLFVRWRTLAPLPVFGLALLVIAGGLVFEYWPMWLIGWVPGMAFNSWSRAISILDLALVVLGACALDYLWRKATAHRRKVLQSLVVAVALLQFAEITYFFRLYNGPVSAKFYYPDSPSIAYMRERAGPFDYVLADRSFQYSGVLGAYGLPEWFAHSFHTPAVRRALVEMVDHPFISRTAAAFSARDINVTSPTMQAFNVRYLAVASDNNRAKGPPGVKGAGHEALPPLPVHRWKQPFTVDRKPLALEGITLSLATYHRSDLEGSVTLVLSDADGRSLATARVDARTIIDNNPEDFYFSEPVTLPPGRYAFAVHYAPGAGSPPLTAWAFARPASDATMRVDGKPYPGILDYKLHLHLPSTSPFRRVYTAADIAVYENTRHPGGPYFLPKISDTPDGGSGRAVEIVNYRPGAFALRYVGREPGFVVVPMKMTREWVVRVDGKPAEHSLKAGVMPAIPVSRPSMISFEYRPLAWRWLLPWGLCIASVLGLMWLAERRAARIQQPAGAVR